jgi:prepilin-type N-terminal cleavage/methylation domain-containing protein/prepilin-type processing-associated H-X9-DG protein
MMSPPFGYDADPMRQRAFSLIELLVVIGIIGLLMAIILPVMEKVRHRGYISACAANLHSIGQALVLYSNDSHGAFPRTAYVPGAPPTQGTGAAAPDPFVAGGPQPNDVTADAFLLLRAQKLPPKVFICPYNDVYVYEAEKADPFSHSNFTDPKKNLGYSFANPYPDDDAVQHGYKLTGKLTAGFALAADKNPGTAGYDNRDDVLFPTVTSSSRQKTKANSNNHEKDGQNVLYGDGHVEWQSQAFVGINNDNIFTSQRGAVMASPANRDDSLLLPTDD